jgi:triosephosphate isomerase
MRIPLIAGNWKMNKTPTQAREFAEQLKKSSLSRLPSDVEILICPPFTALSEVAQTIKGSIIKLGAQNMHWETKGAYTGEISGEFLLDLGCQYVILGHSERRRYFSESDEVINKKIVTALKIGLKPILCVGEQLSERESNQTFQVIKRQLDSGLSNINNIENIVIAYEPVWAIGTGKTATPEQAKEVHFYIRENIAQKYGKDVASNLRILYGGSVTPENIDILMTQDGIDGALVGGASLKIDSFLRLINFFYHEYH